MLSELTYECPRAITEIGYQAYSNTTPSNRKGELDHNEGFLVAQSTFRKNGNESVSVLVAFEDTDGVGIAFGETDPPQTLVTHFDPPRRRIRTPGSHASDPQEVRVVVPFVGTHKVGVSASCEIRVSPNEVNPVSVIEPMNGQLSLLCESMPEG